MIKTTKDEIVTPFTVPSMFYGYPKWMPWTASRMTMTKEQYESWLLGSWVFDEEETLP